MDEDAKVKRSEEEMVQLQKLSAEYEPDVTGPLVSEKTSCEAITKEYAKADPIFVRKTEWLPQKFSHYRTVRGDGNCGWRAIAFSYFEALLHHQDRLETELSRLIALNPMLEAAGYNSYVYEDFANETFSLLKSMKGSESDFALLTAFNDEEVSNAIVTHFRLLTGAYMKTQPDDFAPFVEGGSIAQYCSSAIEPFKVEIEHVGMKALIDCVVLPAHVDVKIMYLDRSEGSEVNSHNFEAKEKDSEWKGEVPVIRLLYRPGHYDVLYQKSS